MIELPKPDKRYNPGKIVKDKKGVYRGHPITVTPKRAEILNNAHIDAIKYNLNPPIIVSGELAAFLKGIL